MYFFIRKKLILNTSHVFLHQCPLFPGDLVYHDHHPQDALLLSQWAEDHLSCWLPHVDVLLLLGLAEDCPDSNGHWQVHSYLQSSPLPNHHDSQTLYPSDSWILSLWLPPVLPEISWIATLPFCDPADLLWLHTCAELGLHRYIPGGHCGCHPCSGDPGLLPGHRPILQPDHCGDCGDGLGWRPSQSLFYLCCPPCCILVVFLAVWLSCTCDSQPPTQCYGTQQLQSLLLSLLPSSTPFSIAWEIKIWKMQLGGFSAARRGLVGLGARLRS